MYRTGQAMLGALNRAKFGVVVAKTGTHSALFVEKKMYEVQWGKGPDAPRLYKVTDFVPWTRSWDYGIMVIPAATWPWP